jgi:acylphosphatase
MVVIKRVNLVILGHVQGVFFRASAHQQAQRLGLKGFVCNLNDGSVNVVAEGYQQDIEDFIGWCKLGPETARVEKVVVKYEPVTESEIGFSIIS